MTAKEKMVTGLRHSRKQSRELLVQTVFLWTEDKCAEELFVN